MGDFLFSFVGRMKRIQYAISIVCVVLAFAAVLALQQSLGDWKFADIFTTTLAVVPVIIYLAGTTRRFKDLGIYPLLGFFICYFVPAFYFAILAFILFGLQMALGHIKLNNPETLVPDAQAILFQTQWSVDVLIFASSIAAACLLFLAGQISLFLWRGTTSKNVFNEAGINT